MADEDRSKTELFPIMAIILRIAFFHGLVRCRSSKRRSLVCHERSCQATRFCMPPESSDIFIPSILLLSPFSISSFNFLLPHISNTSYQNLLNIILLIILSLSDTVGLIGLFKRCVFSSEIVISKFGFLMHHLRCK